MTWADELNRQWDEEDRRARAGTATCCGRRDWVELYREGRLLWIHCRHCHIVSKVEV